MKKENDIIFLTDEEMEQIAGGYADAASDSEKITGVTLKYGVVPVPEYGVVPLYGIIPAPEYGIVPLYGILTSEG